MREIAVRVRPSAVLHNLPVGARFILCRTGEKFSIIRREIIKNRLRTICRQESSGRVGWLHHACHVKPVVRVM